jgi:hypothetical protein
MIATLLAGVAVFMTCLALAAIDSNRPTIVPSDNRMHD